MDNIIRKHFEVYYRHPGGGFRLIATVPLAITCDAGEVHDQSMIHWLEELYWRMQGENWSPNGEAREVLMLTGVQHTSMSVGDITRCVESGEVWRVEDIGWKDVTGESPCGA